MKRYDIGTPFGGERKQTRTESPLQQMDGLGDDDRPAAASGEVEATTMHMMQAMMKDMKDLRKE
eukprot:1232949-Pyramimonas_sp.AAC.1